MPLSPAYYPYDYHSVYRPVVYRVISDRYQLGNLFNANGLIQSVRVPTTAEIDAYGLDPSAVVLEHTNPDTMIPGELYRLYDTRGVSDVSGTNRYPGLYRVVRVLTTNTAVISASYVGEETTGGFIQRVLGNYNVFAKISGPNIPTPIEYPLKPVLEDNVYGPGSTQYVFTLDCRDALARHFKDIAQIADTASTEITNAEGYLTMRYDVEFTEGYDVVNPNGTITFTRFSYDDSGGIRFTGQTCVNAVHPYHHVERNGDITLDWASSFNTDHVLSTVGVGNSRKFMTYMDRSKTTIRSGDSFFLAWMWQGAASRTKVRIRYGQSDDTILQTVDIGNTPNALLSATSYICNVGKAVDSAPAGATQFQAFLINTTNGSRLSEIFKFNIVPCKGVNKRWYYLNKLGGLDAFTFAGDETRQMGVTRDIVQRDAMRIPELVGYSGQTFRGDYQRRVWRTQPNRRYTLSSGYMLPAELRVIAEEMFESPMIVTEVRDGWWTPVIPITTDVPGDSSSSRAERFVLEYALGVDNVTQRT